MHTDATSSRRPAPRRSAPGAAASDRSSWRCRARTQSWSSPLRSGRNHCADWAYPLPCPWQPSPWRPRSHRDASRSRLKSLRLVVHLRGRMQSPCRRTLGAVAPFRSDREASLWDFNRQSCCSVGFYFWINTACPVTQGASNGRRKPGKRGANHMPEQAVRHQNSGSPGIRTGTNQLCIPPRFSPPPHCGVCGLDYPFAPPKCVGAPAI